MGVSNQGIEEALCDREHPRPPGILMLSWPKRYSQSCQSICSIADYAANRERLGRKAACKCQQAMRNVRFADPDFHAETIAVALAEIRAEVRSVGTISNRFGSVRRLIGRLGKRAGLRVCDRFHLELLPICGA